MRITCLHTVESNVAVFEAAARPPGAELRHVVRADLLEEAERAGGLTPGIEARAVDALLSLAEGADAVLLTCSTVGPAAAAAAARARVPVLRVDAALAEAAVAQGDRIVVLCAVQTTMAPTRALFEAAARGRPVMLDVQLLPPDVWAAFKAGDVGRYHALIAAAADAAFAAGADVVALAQASMAGAVPLARGGRPLASPAAGLAAVAGGVPTTA
jgi:aspartate/glutamate racemase